MTRQYAGRRAVETARGNIWWKILHPLGCLVEPDDLSAAIDGTSRMGQVPPIARKAMLCCVISATNQDTRERMVETIVAEAAKGERVEG